MSDIMLDSFKPANVLIWWERGGGAAILTWGAVPLLLIPSSLHALLILIVANKLNSLFFDK